MENYLNENFGSVKSKNSSEEALQRWRRLYGLVKNGGLRWESDEEKHKNKEKLRIALYVRKAALQFIDAAGQFIRRSEPEDESLREHLLTEAAEASTDEESELEHVSSLEHILAEASEARINQESVDDVGSTDNRKSVSKLLDKYKKCALALFYVLLEAASFSLDIAGKMKWRILLAAFVFAGI